GEGGGGGVDVGEKEGKGGGGDGGSGDRLGYELNAQRFRAVHAAGRRGAGARRLRRDYKRQCASQAVAGLGPRRLRRDYKEEGSCSDQVTRRPISRAATTTAVP